MTDERGPSNPTVDEVAISPMTADYADGSLQLEPTSRFDRRAWLDLG
jgi:hypothetical protein